jgi:hypothetical protein
MVERDMVVTLNTSEPWFVAFLTKQYTLWYILNIFAVLPLSIG